MFGLRKVPIEIRNRFEREGIVFDEEGTSCALSYREFRGPNKSSGRGFEGAAVGTLVITHRSFYVHFPYMILCDQPVDKAVQFLDLDLQGPKELTMKFEVEKLFAQSTGNLTCLWRTEKAAEIFDHLRDLETRPSMDNPNK